MEQQIIEATTTFVSSEERAQLVLLCSRLAGDIDVAEDLAQETLLEAWRHLYNLRDQARRQQWLSGIARNICLRWRRAQGKDAAHLLEPRVGDTQFDEDLLADEFDIEVELERKELIELLDRALALLPAETRSVLVKRYIEESPLATVADELGMNVSAVAMRLQRGKLALRRVLTGDLLQEIAPYTLHPTATIAGDAWEQTSLWCHLCGQHRLLGMRKPGEGKLLLKCPGCNPRREEVLSYNELPLLKEARGYKSLMTRLRNWCSFYYWTGLRNGSIACKECGRMLPVRIIKVEDTPAWISRNDEAARWMCQNGDRFITIFCEPCRASYRTSLGNLVLNLPQGRQFLKAHPRIRSLPNQEIETGGRLAIVSRFESITDNAWLTVISDYETYKTLQIDGGTL